MAEHLAKTVPLRQYGNIEVLRTETGGASPIPPLDTCLDRVRSSDLFILCLGFSFGSTIKGDPSGRSYTEAEFDAAIEAEIPILAFVSTSKKLFRRAEIDALDFEITRFRRKVADAQESKGFMLQEFASWEQFNTTLQKALDANLPDVVAATPETQTAPVDNLILPRAEYPAFDGMDGETLHGRHAELQRLDDWLADPAQSGLMIRAIGGMGKTSLAWCWLDTLTETSETAPISGIFWFSFYAGDHSFRLFARKLRGWLEPHAAPERRQVIRPEESDWTAAKHYLEGLKHKPLVILDGLEAEFVGYIGRKPVTLGSLGSSFGGATGADAIEEAHDVLHDFAQFTDAAGGASLVDFIQSNLAKILITTREVPTAFVRMSRGQERLIGKLDEIILEELSSDCARELLNEFGVRAKEQTLKTLLASAVIRHPLILTIFANRVIADDVALGNLDAYIARYPDQNIMEFAIQRRTHILRFVFDDLTDVERLVLEMITVSDVAMPRDFIEAAAIRKGYNQDTISEALDHLKSKRGLIHAARRKAPDEDQTETFYSMHPVCRGYWKETNLASLKESAEFIDEQFEEHLFGGIGRGVTSPTVFDLEARVLVITRVAIEAERYSRAWKLFEPFRQYYGKFGFYGHFLEFVTYFLRFERQGDAIVAKTPIEETEQAAEVLRDGANIFRLFGQTDRAIACAEALVKLVHSQKSVGETASPGSAKMKLPSVLEAEWVRVLSSLSVQNYPERQSALKELWTLFEEKGSDPKAAILVGQLMSESLKYFEPDPKSDFIPYNEFLLTLASSTAGAADYNSLVWNLVFRLDHLSSQGWTEETVVDSADSLFQEANTRELRVVMLHLMNSFLHRGQLGQAQKIQDRLDEMTGWAQLDLEEHRQWLRISLALKVAEDERDTLPEKADDILSLIDTCEVHYRDRLTRSDRVWIAASRLRVAVLSDSEEATSLLEYAVEQCLNLAHPRHNQSVKDILRCAKILERHDVVDQMEAELPERYDLPWCLPDPFFGFLPDPRLCGTRPWEETAGDGDT